jgi:hypothetical protein
MFILNEAGRRFFMRKYVDEVDERKNAKASLTQPITFSRKAISFPTPAVIQPGVMPSNSMAAIPWFGDSYSGAQVNRDELKNLAILSRGFSGSKSKLEELAYRQWQDDVGFCQEQYAVSPGKTIVSR